MNSLSLCVATWLPCLIDDRDFGDVWVMFHDTLDVEGISIESTADDHALGAVEQHQKTILLDFNDHLGDFDRFGRADMLFAKDKAIGAPLISLHAVPDLPRAVQERLYFVRYEDLMAQPAACMSSIFKWLGVSALQIDPNALEIGIPESDSHYRMKYRHTQSSKITPARRHEISPRIQAHIESAYAWFYQTYYPK